MSASHASHATRALPGFRLRLCQWAAVVLLGLALVAAGRTLHAAWTRARAPGADDLARLAALPDLIPRQGPDVELAPGSGVALVGYLTYPEAFTPFDRAIADPVLRLRIDEASMHYLLTQQVLAPRVLLLPSHPAHAAVRLLVGHFEQAADVPAAAGIGLVEVANLGNGIVLWRRP